MSHYTEFEENKKETLARYPAPRYSTEEFDVINKPKHYNSDPSGVEPIQITQHMSFCLGNVTKYLMRHKHKGGLEDLKKAQWYLNREIERLSNESKN